MVEVFLSEALLCVLGQCYPVLVGERTPVGHYTLQHVELQYDGKSERVLMFAPDRPGRVLAIHKLPNKAREILLTEQSKAKVTAGCINVSTEVFDYLVECCSDQELIVHP